MYHKYDKVISINAQMAPASCTSAFNEGNVLKSIAALQYGPGGMSTAVLTNPCVW